MVNFINLIAHILQQKHWALVLDEEQVWHILHGDFKMTTEGILRAFVVGSSEVYLPDTQRVFREDEIETVQECFSLEDAMDQMMGVISPKNPKGKPDMVNQPPHYKGHPSGLECIQITEHMDFNLGNAFKYLYRAGSKGSASQDVKKAKWYVTNAKKYLVEGESKKKAFSLCRDLFVQHEDRALLKMILEAFEKQDISLLYKCECILEGMIAENEWKDSKPQLAPEA